MRGQQSSLTSGDIMCRRWNAMEVCGRKIPEAPPTTAYSQRPVSRSVMASLKAMSDDEHAAKRVSTHQTNKLPFPSPTIAALHVRCRMRPVHTQQQQCNAC